MITAIHAIMYSTDAEATRVFLRDMLGFNSVDGGDGWLIFALPPAELAVHPGEAHRHELYLMCDDIHRTIEDLASRGVEIGGPVSDEGWGLLTSIVVPGGGSLGLYEPRHLSPIGPRS